MNATIPLFEYAIVRKPAKTYAQGITTANLGKPDISKALQQHKAYITALKKCGLTVIEMSSLDAYPDSCFVEDTAVVNKKVAIITNPGAASRKGEEESVSEILKKYFSTVTKINSPGTLEGGDILQIGTQYYIGLSQRTNEYGAQQLQTILGIHGFSTTMITLTKVLHLKTGINYIGNNCLAVAGEFIDHPVTKGHTIISVPPDELYAANCLRVNEYVLIPQGFPKVKEQIVQQGIPIIELNMSEFQKMDGGLTCLSLRF